MGIRGATSLLFKDRHRFGTSWIMESATTSNETEDTNSNVETEHNHKKPKIKNTIIYIDGPALLYHLLSSKPPNLINTSSTMDGFKKDGKTRQNFHTKYTHHALITHCINGWDNFNSYDPISPQPTPAYGMISPHQIYHRAYVFAKCLLMAGAQEVYLIMEGLAPKEKLPQQLERLMHSRSLCESASREIIQIKTNTNITSKDYHHRSQTYKNVPHLFSEHAMTRAFLEVNNEKRTNDTNDTVFVEYANGEAENHIAQKLQDDPSYTNHASQNNYKQSIHSDDYIILSNDSDFLVYECAADGFIPLSTIEFHIELKHHTTVQRKNDKFASNEHILINGWKFIRSKFLRQMDLRSYHMPIVAALGGCDYEPSSPDCLQLSKRLHQARRIILQSDKSGLSQKQKKKPSAYSNLLAVLRFTKYCQNATRRHSQKFEKHAKDIDLKTQQKAFLDKLSSEIACYGKPAEQEERQMELVQVLEIISASYQYSNTNDSTCPTTGTPSYSMNGTTIFKFQRYPSELILDLRRIVEQGIFFCRPTLEVYPSEKIHSSIWLEPHMMRFRENLYKILFHVQSLNSTVVASSNINPVVQEYCPHSLHPRKVFLSSSSDSTEDKWKVELQTAYNTSRSQIENISTLTSSTFSSLIPESLIFHIAMKGFHFASGSVDSFQDILVTLHPKWHEIFLVGSMLLLQEYKIPFQAKNNRVAQIGGERNKRWHCAKVKDPFTSPSITKDAFLIFSLISTIPSTLVTPINDSYRLKNKSDNILSPRMLYLLSIIQVASYHISMLLSLVSCVHGKESKNHSFKWHNIFQDNVFSLCFNVIKNTILPMKKDHTRLRDLSSIWDKFREQNFESPGSFPISFLDNVLESLVEKIYRDESIRSTKEIRHELNEWRNSILLLWDSWQKFDR